MSPDAFDALMREADRMWGTVESLDALHGGDRAWRWTHLQVERLARESRWEDPEAVGKLADVLERRLARDRRGATP